MNKIWKDILEYWEKYISPESPGAGASPEELSVLEYYLGQDLPPSFKEFYKIHNGFREPIILPHPSSLLSLEEILERWSALNKLFAKEPLSEEEFEGCTSQCKEVKKVRWTPGWIPFTISTRGRDYYCLDFEPAPHGISGQIIFFSTDMGDREFISESFEAFITKYTQSLTAGKYTL